jgi:hypothetical protein
LPTLSRPSAVGFPSTSLKSLLFLTNSGPIWVQC